ADHAKEMNSEIPDEPVIFMKPKSALVQNHTPFYYPEFTNELHYECELVVRISKNGKYIQEKHASNYYNAISVGIDFTARDIQLQLKEKGLPWEKSKSFDNSAAVGSFVEITPAMNKKNINFSFEKNKEVVQNGNSKDMIFSIDAVIANISNYFSLNIGDLIFTGTPAGVGECMVGDTLQGYLEGASLLSMEIK
ncbi:MAG: fumarylacetoacetate hydrolase family protein, partial [Bacteroidota bacterium]|nr:fumarylacetoacetate hydrolase family protein [Bacteroidota bacterium]